MAFTPQDKPHDGMILLPNQGPWGGRGGPGNGNEPGNQGGGNQGGGDGGNPWGQRPGGGRPGGDDPDLDAMLRQAQDKFKSTFGGGGRRPAGDIDPGKAIFALLGIIALIWLSTGFYTVQPQENALILTFGKVTDTKTESGLGYHLPQPIQQDIKVAVARNNQIDVGFITTGGGRTDNPKESMMLTGDANIVNIHFSVFWHIGDANKYTFDITDPDVTVKKVAESAIREIIGRTEIQKAMTEGRAEIESSTKDLMQKVLDDYQAGVVINSIQLLSVDPPAPVVDAFNDVQRARTDKERAKNEAETYQNDIVPRAKGDAQKIIQDAGAYKEATVATAQGEAEKFTTVYNAYALAKDVTQRRMYIETMSEILKNSKKIIAGDEKGSSVLPWLQVDPKSAAARATMPPQP